MIRNAGCLKTEKILLELVMADYTQLVRRASELVASNRSDPALNAYWIAKHLDADLSELDSALYKAQDVLAKNILSTTELAGFAGWSSKHLIASRGVSS